jgi:DNA-3-methyladenine glycosylase I
MNDFSRCPWARSEREIAYHDREWGVPRHDDLGQFEFLTLEAAQAGLSWSTILNKREGYRQAFAGFDPAKVALFTEKEVAELMENSAIVRNRKKITGAIKNAGVFLNVAATYGSFAAYLWRFVDGQPLVNWWKDPAEVPAATDLSRTISRELKRLGFTFMGPTVVYAHLQATGLVNDHLVSCRRHRDVGHEAIRQ